MQYLSRSMRCWSLILAGAAIGLAGCEIRIGQDNAVQGNGVRVSEVRQTSAFSRIEVGGMAKLTWSPAAEQNLEVTVEQNLLPYLVTEVVNDTLRIYFKENVRPTRDVLVQVASAKLDGFSAGGATESVLKDVKSDDFQLSVSGSSKCTISGSAGALAVECSGASAVEGADFQAGSATVSASGNSTVEFAATYLRAVTASGASTVKSNGVRAKSLTIDVSGNSRCDLSGQVDGLVIEANGASAVLAAGLTAHTVAVDVNGASHVELQCTGTFAGVAAGASSVVYGGTPTTESVSTSGTASIRRK